MMKLPSLLLAFVLPAGTLLAQSEPPTQKPLSGATPAPNAPGSATVPPILTPAAKGRDTAKAAPKKDTPPLDPKNMDPSVKPAEDFYQFANGGWLKRNPVPPEFSRWSSFNELAEKNNTALKEIAERAAAEGAKQGAGPETQMVGNYYASGMDERAIDAARAKPFEGEFQKIEAIKDRADVLKAVAHLHTLGVNAFFYFTAGQDEKNSEMMIALAYQGGLGLPDRDYYTKTDDASKKLRGEYVEHVAKMFTLLGAPAAAAKENAQKVLALETSLAEPARTRVELRDPQKNYNKMTQAQLQELTPNWSWADYFREINLADAGDINVGQPDFFRAADKVFHDISVEDWKTYLRWQLIHAAAGELSAEFVNENFRFFEKTLRGSEKIRPRWKRVVASTDSSLGEALGKLYVEEHFPAEAKERALEMVENLREAMADRIKTLEWMDEPTKQEALKKLAAFRVKIGYPDKWRDYSGLKIDRGPYVLNAARAAEFEQRRTLQKIGQPVDPDEWYMSPPTVNAYYNPTMNEIVFPAGILQPPFFDANADDAMNYGGIGAVIGHELTHGFDDQGRQYDAEGNLRDWWTKESSDAYNERAKKIVAQYAAYEPLPGLHINGELTQGENIADIGGLKLAYMALQKALSKNPQPEKIDGFTQDQRFFLGWAQIWRMNMREQEQKLRLNTDPHSPGRYRTIGPISNFEEFAKAFDIPADSKMTRPPEDRVNIW
ncbi:MAG: M13 family peptidase [Chthoniobacterales bacterium]|nr:M13 family peptidase [Chthoniobacterales bacterium]